MFPKGLSRSRLASHGFGVEPAGLSGARPGSHGTVTGNPPAAQRVRAGPHSDPAQYTVRGTVTGGRRLGPRRPTKKLEAAAVPGHRVPAARVARRRFKLPASTVTSTLPGPGWSHVFVALATVTCQPASASHGESRNFKLKLPG